MIIRKDLIIAILATFCLTAVLFTAMPVSSSGKQYDPWLDYNDDGIIDLKDVYSMHQAYGTEGDPINKTDLLLKLQAKIESLNETITQMNSLITSLQMKSDSVKTVCNGSWSTLGLNVYGSNSWATVPDLRVMIRLNQTSFLRITTCERWQVTSGGRIRALVDSEVAYPSAVDLDAVGMNENDYQSMDFYLPNLTEGVHTVEIQWFGSPSTYYSIQNRILIVTASPT